MRAKIEAVMGAVALVFAPLALVLALASPPAALAAAIFIAIATASATAIQFWFRSQAKRSHFRRRQTSSRVATFAEALSSVGWAATGALAAIVGLIVLGILAGTRWLSPARA
jgi:ABC-2 type transport system permease protein